MNIMVNLLHTKLIWPNTSPQNSCPLYVFSQGDSSEDSGMKKTGCHSVASMHVLVTLSNTNVGASGMGFAGKTESVDFQWISWNIITLYLIK